MSKGKHVCTGECRKKSTAEMAAGAALLGLTIGAMVACPLGGSGGPDQPLYGISIDDDDSAEIDDDDSAQIDDDDATDDDDADQPLYGVGIDDDDAGDDDDSAADDTPDEPE